MILKKSIKCSVGLDYKVLVDSVYLVYNYINAEKMVHLTMHICIKTAIISVTLERLLCHLTLSALCILSSDCLHILTLLKFHISKTLKLNFVFVLKFLLIFTLNPISH